MEAAIRDSSPHALATRVEGTGLSLAPGVTGQCLVLAGTGRLVATVPPAARPRDAVTLCAWVRAEPRQPYTAGFAGVVECAQAYRLCLVNAEPPYAIHFGVQLASGTWAAANSSRKIPAGQWTHLAGTFDGETAMPPLHRRGGRERDVPSGFGPAGTARRHQIGVRVAALISRAAWFGALPRRPADGDPGTASVQSAVTRAPVMVHRAAAAARAVGAAPVRGGARGSRPDTNEAVGATGGGWRRNLEEPVHPSAGLQPGKALTVASYRRVLRQALAQARGLLTVSVTRYPCASAASCPMLAAACLSSLPVCRLSRPRVIRRPRPARCRPHSPLTVRPSPTACNCSRNSRGTGAMPSPIPRL